MLLLKGLLLLCKLLCKLLFVRLDGRYNIGLALCLQLGHLGLELADLLLVPLQLCCVVQDFVHNRVVLNELGTRGKLECAERFVGVLAGGGHSADDSGLRVPSEGVLGCRGEEMNGSAGSSSVSGPMAGGSKPVKAFA